MNKYNSDKENNHKEVVSKAINRREEDCREEEVPSGEGTCKRTRMT